MSLTKNEARERYHVAKLGLFNIRLLSVLEKSQSDEINRVIDSVVMKNGFSYPPSLLHQGSFLSFSYICLVWLFESIKKAGLEKAFLDKLISKAREFALDLPSNDTISGPRELKDWDSVLRLVRNALSHGNIEIEDKYFIFIDQTKNGRHKEKHETRLKLSWEELGKLSECCIHALTPVLYPNLQENSPRRDEHFPKQ